ncbi:hypothetical protein [Methylobacterium planeticum]|uniref:Uncharacterized protein n=1 Tax=Methylobacterium planeticum TaxID=2615211 RepID=A0A6N6MN93_9HYPH|nr:hypothetical protein [Methylobacterium planeticum]KAB1071629.1 hypothetical protein F6X51_18870 [Methylobacterium planeticum]
MSFGVTGLHGLEQTFAAEVIAEGEFGVSVRQGGDQIVLIRLRDGSEANARALAALLAEKASAVMTPSVVQAMLDEAITPGPAV